MCVGTGERDYEAAKDYPTRSIGRKTGSKGGGGYIIFRRYQYAIDPMQSTYNRFMTIPSKCYAYALYLVLANTLCCSVADQHLLVDNFSTCQSLVCLHLLSVF